MVGPGASLFFSCAFAFVAQCIRHPGKNAARKFGKTRAHFQRLIDTNFGAIEHDRTRAPRRCVLD